MTDFFQSKSWADFQRALGEQVVTAEGDGWHYWGRTTQDKLGTYLYLPYGPVARDEKALDAAIADAKARGKELGAYRLLVEPALPITPEIAAQKFDRQLFGFQPSRSQIVDLTMSEEDIIGGMNASRRKQHRGAARKGMTFEQSTSREDYDKGVELLRASGDEKSFAVREGEFFDLFWDHLVVPGLAKIFVARLHDEIQVVAFVIDDADTRYYLYVGRDLGNNSLQVSSPFIAYMMLDAKQQGLKHFDLFGLSASDDVEDSMTGFTVFKRTFGGETVQYAGTWELGISSLKSGLRRFLDNRRS